MKVYEVITYKQKEEVTDEVILKQSQVLQDIIKDLKGLISRKLAKSEDGIWLDCVLWDSMEHAKSAGQVVESNPGSAEFMNLVQAETVTMNHFTVEDDYM